MNEKLITAERSAVRLVEDLQAAYSDSIEPAEQIILEGMLTAAVEIQMDLERIAGIK